MQLCLPSAHARMHALHVHVHVQGVAVFLASMKSTAVGASLAFAIALHNIPEGVAVSLPVYFATGSRLKGFLYAFVSGAEPDLGQGAGGRGQDTMFLQTALAAWLVYVIIPPTWHHLTAPVACSAVLLACMCASTRTCMHPYMRVYALAAACRPGGAAGGGGAGALLPLQPGQVSACWPGRQPSGYEAVQP